MVMRLFLLLISGCLLGCARGYFLPEGGLRPKNYKEKSYEKYSIVKSDLNSKVIDTNAIYVSMATVYTINKEKIFKPIDTTKNKWAYRFYSNGRYSYFNLYDRHFLYDHPISKLDLDPKSGVMGFYKVNSKGEIIKKSYSRTLGGDIFVKGKLFIKNDTLYKDNIIFIKKQVPKEWLNWKPDW